MPYSGDPAASGLDAVRFWAQDTGSPPLLTDAEISYLISFAGVDAQQQPIMVAALVADRIAAKYAGEVSINADGVSYSGDQLQNRYSALAEELRKSERRMQDRGALPIVGGIKVGISPPPGIRQPQFGIGMFDNPEGGTQEYGYLGEYGQTTPADIVDD